MMDDINTFFKKKGRPRTTVVRVPTHVLDGVRRVIPDQEVTDYERFTILWKFSAVNLEDALGGRKRKNVREKR